MDKKSLLVSMVRKQQIEVELTAKLLQTQTQRLTELQENLLCCIGDSKPFKITDLFKDNELRLASLHKQDASWLCDNIISLKLDEINEITGQKNDAMYLAYALQNALLN